MNQTISDSYYAELNRAATPEARDKVLRSIYHFAHRGDAISTTHLTNEYLERYALQALRH